MTRRAAAPPPSPQADLRLATALSGLLEALTPYLVEAMVVALATAGFAAGRPSPLAARQPVGGPVAFTVEQAAERAGLSRSFLYNEIAKGNLVLHKSGARSLVLPADLDGFLFALPTLKRRATDGATDAAPAAPTANPPVGHPCAAAIDNNGAAATGDRRAARRAEPRRVDRDADQGGAADGQRRSARLAMAHGAPEDRDDARRNPPRGAPRPPAPRRTAAKKIGKAL